MKEQILDRLTQLLEYFKSPEHVSNDKDYTLINQGTINGITYAIRSIEDFFENPDEEDPTVEERKQGYWLKKHHVSDASEFTAICCSSCGYKVNFFLE